MPTVWVTGSATVTAQGAEAGRGRRDRRRAGGTAPAASRGGGGTARRAAEAASRMRGWFSGGVYFVSLGEVRDAALVVPEVAKAIGATETGTDLQELLVKRLAGRRALIVLDTFEHLTAAAPQVYAAMLGSPEITFLVTSRSALRLRG